ncbi:MAG: tetratricopeptide repeat-containing sensor histidine kinase [Ignavibacteriaceae bacterium]
MNRYTGIIKSLGPSVLLFVFILTSKLYSQQRIADSLQIQLSCLQGERKVEVLNELSDIYQYINTKLSIDFALKGIELAKTIHYKKGLAGCYGSLGYCYINIDMVKAVKYTKEALQIRYEISDKAGIATSQNVLGVISYYEGDYLASIEYHLKALKMREIINDKIKMATSYNNVALVYLALEEYDTALFYMNKALAIRIETNNKKGIAIIKGNIGDIYSRLGMYKKAFEYLKDALRINKEIGNLKSEAGTYLVIAKIYKKLGDNNNSINNYKLADKLYRELDEKHGIAQAENGLALIYYDQGNTSLATDHAYISLAYADSINSLDNIALAANILQSSFQKAGHYKKAYKYLTLYKSSSDSLKITDKIKKLAKEEFDYKLEKIKGEQKLEIAKQQIFIKWLIITLILSIIIVSLIVYGYFHKKKINVKLLELNNKLRELNSAKDRFFSIIAHDLRGPFQSLLGFSEILSKNIETLSTAEIKEFYTQINLSLESQYELLNNLLDWAKLQSEKFNIVSEDILLHKELNKTIEALSLTAHEKNITIINDIPKDLKISADKNMLQLVLRNIIVNGIKFSYKNDIVKITTEQLDDFVKVIISDNGVGISENDLNKIFRIDINHSTPGTSDEKGTGLGLILCKEIVEKHGGKIWINGKGKGTEVSFTLKSVLT